MDAESVKDEDIKVNSISYKKDLDGNRSDPFLAKVTYKDKSHLVSISGDTQMSQQIFNAYLAQELEDGSKETFPTITKNEDNLENLDNAVAYAHKKINAEKEFIIPINSSLRGSGHTIFLVGARGEDGNYKTTILDQTGGNAKLEELQSIVLKITSEIARGKVIQSDNPVITGAFPGKGAGCQEVGCCLIDAIKAGNLAQTIADCKDETKHNLNPKKLAKVRFKAALALNKQNGDDPVTRINTLSGTELTASQQLTLALKLKLDEGDQVILNNHLIAKENKSLTDSGKAELLENEKSRFLKDQLETIRENCLTNIVIPYDETIETNLNKKTSNGVEIDVLTPASPQASQKAEIEHKSKSFANAFDSIKISEESKKSYNEIIERIKFTLNGNTEQLSTKEAKKENIKELIEKIRLHEMKFYSGFPGVPQMSDAEAHKAFPAIRDSATQKSIFVVPNKEETDIGAIIVEKKGDKYDLEIIGDKPPQAIRVKVDGQSFSIDENGRIPEGKDRDIAKTLLSEKSFNKLTGRRNIEISVASPLMESVKGVGVSPEPGGHSHGIKGHESIVK